MPAGRTIDHRSLASRSGAPRVDFRPSPTPTLGVEVELALVDPESRALVSKAVPILEEMGRDHPDGEHPKAKHELFQYTVEVITGICDTVQDAEADLRSTLAELVSVATRHDAAIISAATHPFSHWDDQELSPGERYRAFLERLGWPVRRLAIQGTHYHVGVRTPEAALAITHALCEHLPLLLAMSASSPFWHGLDTSMASVRTKIFEALPNAGLPPRLADWRSYETFVAALIRAGAIQSIREVWWDVRPHPNFGTVELRMCDAMQTLDEVLALAALAQCLVADLQARVEAGEPVPEPVDWVVSENKWLAARHGMDARFLVDASGNREPAREILARTVEELEPTAQRLGCAHELGNVVWLAERSGGHDRQRAVVTRGGTTTDVVDMLMAEFTGPGGFAAPRRRRDDTGQPPELAAASPPPPDGTGAGTASPG